MKTACCIVRCTVNADSNRTVGSTNRAKIENRQKEKQLLDKSNNYHFQVYQPDTICYRKIGIRETFGPSFLVEQMFIEKKIKYHCKTIEIPRYNAQSLKYFN